MPNNKSKPQFKKPRAMGLPPQPLKIEAGKYFVTRGGWQALVIYLPVGMNYCLAVHNVGTAAEVGPCAHTLKEGFAIVAEPAGLCAAPVYHVGHPADFLEEVIVS